MTAPAGIEKHPPRPEPERSMALLAETRLALGPRNADATFYRNREALRLLALARQLVHDLAGPHLAEGELDEMCPGCCCRGVLRQDCPVRATVYRWASLEAAAAAEPGHGRPVRITWLFGGPQ